MVSLTFKVSRNFVNILTNIIHVKQLLFFEYVKNKYNKYEYLYDMKSQQFICYLKKPKYNIYKDSIINDGYIIYFPHIADA